MSHLRKILLLSILVLSFQTVKGQYDINQFFIRGRQFLIDGKYSRAIDSFNILARLDDSLYEAFFFRGIAKYNLGDFLGAQLDFDRTIEINPVYTPAYHYRAITLSRVGKYDLALKDLEEAVELRPSYVGLYFSRGVTYFLSQQFDKAIADFNVFIKKEPKEPDAYLNRGAAYLFTGDTLKALGDYNKAITLNRFEPEGYIRRSRIYQLQNRFEDAIKDLNNAIELDPENGFAYFNRALLKYESKDISGSLDDLNRVLEQEPGNALTLYNRALIRSQIGDYHNALDDYDRVLNINPENVLAYFNRASLFLELGRYDDAVNDYSRAIELYPDFAKAYMNRAYVKNKQGRFKSAEQDYLIAQQKVDEYKKRSAEATDFTAMADTSKTFNKLLDLDADFAKKDFNDELLQYRDVDIRLKPHYKFASASGKSNGLIALEKRFQNPTIDQFIEESTIPLELTCKSFSNSGVDNQRVIDELNKEMRRRKDSEKLFAKGVLESENRQFNAALTCYNEAIELNPNNIFYYLNRGVLQSDMIDFISSIESSVQVLSLDNAGTAKARVPEKSHRNYDYSAAIKDMKRAVELFPDFPFSYYNLGNLYCMANNLPEAISQYTIAIDKYPYIGEAYYNRGLVLIFLRDKEKGCIDLSKAGELGISDAYSVIKKYCKTE